MFILKVIDEDRELKFETLCEVLQFLRSHFNLDGINAKINENCFNFYSENILYGCARKENNGNF